MRTPLLFASVLLLSGPLAAQTIVLEENFDTYVSGLLIAETAGAPWTTWSMAPGGSEDTPVSDEQAYSGSNSGKWATTVVGGGPTDMVLDLGAQTEGVWRVSFQMYIPTGKGGYFNILHNFNGAGSEWAASFTFAASGSCTAMANNIPTALTYPHDVWFPVSIDVDLGTSAAAVTIATNDALEWPFNTQETGGAGLNQLDAVNFFAFAGGVDQTTYYIDDLLVEDYTGVGIVENRGSGVQLYPNPVSDRIVLDAAGATTAGLWNLRDATGRILMTGGRLMAGARQEVDLFQLPAGVYLFELQQQGRRTTQRIVKR